MAGWENSQARSIKPRRLNAGSASASNCTRTRAIPAGSHGVDNGRIILVQGGSSKPRVLANVSANAAATFPPNGGIHLAGLEGR